MSAKTKQGMHPELIKAQIRMKGKTLKALAEDNDITLASISLALREPCLNAEKVISSYIGIPLHCIWPERWTESGQRIYPRYSDKYI